MLAYPYFFLKSYYLYDILQICALESEREDDEVKHEAIVTLACMSQTLLEPENIPVVLKMIRNVSMQVSSL